MAAPITARTIACFMFLLYGLVDHRYIRARLDNFSIEHLCIFRLYLRNRGLDQLDRVGNESVH